MMSLTGEQTACKSNTPSLVCAFWMLVILHYLQVEFVNIFFKFKSLFILYKSSMG